MLLLAYFFQHQHVHLSIKKMLIASGNMDFNCQHIQIIKASNKQKLRRQNDSVNRNVQPASQLLFLWFYFDHCHAYLSHHSYVRLLSYLFPRMPPFTILTFFVSPF